MCQLRPMASGNEEQGQGTPRQGDLETEETTHREGRHNVLMGPENEIGTRWSNR